MNEEITLLLLLLDSEIVALVGPIRIKIHNPMAIVRKVPATLYCIL
jgi:hypothetical protein